MARTKNKLLDIEKELKKTLKPALKQTAVDLNQMIEDAYEAAIMAFYMDYEPKYYRRTFSTFYGSSLYDNETMILNPKVLSENIYESGITVSSDYIPGQPYAKGKNNKPDKDWVFNRTYKLGIHGTSEPEKAKWGQNDYWIKYLKYIKKYKGTLNQYKKIRNKKYGKSKHKINAKHLTKDASYLSAANMFGWKIGKTSTATIADYYEYGKSQMVGKRNKPIYIMEDSYNKITGKRNIQNMITNNLIYLLSK